MASPRPLKELLPDVPESFPESEWIHTTSVTGPHGITAAVKDWTEVLDWQEHRRALTRGYYRLISTPRVRDLTTRVERRYPGFHAVAYTSAPLAEREVRDFLRVERREAEIRRHAGVPDTLPPNDVHILDLRTGGVRAGIALTDRPAWAEVLFERNRRRGGTLASRAAEHLLEGTSPPGVDDAATECARRLRAWEQAEHALFYPSGMAAVSAALEAVLSPEKNRVIVLGNVYRDTHLLLEEQAWADRDVRTDFLDTRDLEGARRRIRNPAVAAVFVETITNPLIEIPDLPAISELCAEAEVPLLVDGTMAGPLNACPLAEGASMVIHSTSKYLSGHNTHGGGVVLTREARWHDRLREHQTRLDLHVSPTEFPGLLKGLRDYPERLERFNRNGAALAEMLREHPAVGEVFYANAGQPDWLRGLGGVVSCELRDPSLDKVAAFFESPLPGIVKAPSLGSDQTLFCPYVLLAYYDKDDAYLRQSNLSKTLLRFAAGSEKAFDPVLRGVADALDPMGVTR